MAFNTVLKLVPEIGAACADYQDKALRNLPSKLIQCDEIWSFCYAKDKNVPADKRGELGFGDVWTWVAIDPETKVSAVLSWYGTRPHKRPRTVGDDSWEARLPIACSLRQTAIAFI